MELRLELAEILMSYDACSSEEEAEVLAEIVFEFDDSGDPLDDDDKFLSMQDVIIENLIDNLGVDETQANRILLELKRRSGCVSSEDERSSNSEDDEQSSSSELVDAVESSSLNYRSYDDEIDTAEYLVEGECELCDRYIKLTRHHLIPKSTWPRMKAKLLEAASAEENGDRERALVILGNGLEDLLSDGGVNRNQAGYRIKLSSDKDVVRAILHDTCDVCRQCHSTIHRTHTNMDLALNYSSVEKLLRDETISKFCKWASKQKPGKYKRLDG